MAPRDGFEPPARRLTVVCSTAELPGNILITHQFVFNLIIIKCNNLIKEHKELKKKHQGSYSFLTKKLLEKNETDNNENNI